MLKKFAAAVSVAALMGAGVAVADISGAEALGFEPAVALETGLGATARWLSAPAD